MKSKLEIGMMISGHYTIPQPKGIIYAPMLIAQAIAEGLTKKGHLVYFFAPQGSKLKVAKVISGGISPLQGISGKKNLKILSGPNVKEIEVNKIFNLWDQYFISLAYKMALKNKLDLLHIHPIDRGLPFGLAVEKIPVVYTLHDPIYPWRAEIFRMFQSKNQYLVSLSEAQRKPAPDLNWAGTVYNGLDLKKFPFSEKPKSHCLFLGRLLPTKGVKEAIEACKKAKEKLIIAGAPNKGEYWEKEIKPHLSKDIQYVGNIPYEKTYQYYGQAKVTLCPIQWEEPFGLTFIESLACGTPVIVFDRGSAREVVKDGETGFVVKNAEEMIKAIKKSGQIDRKKCRQLVEGNFTNERMVQEYEKIFYRILAKQNLPAKNS